MVKREMRIGEVIVVISFVFTMVGGYFAIKYQVADASNHSKQNSQFIVDASRETIRMFRDASTEIKKTNVRVDVLERKRLEDEAYRRGLEAGGN